MAQRVYTVDELRRGEIPGLGKRRSGRVKRGFKIVLFDRVEIELPITLASEANMSEHQMVAYSRHEKQKDEVKNAFYWLARCPVPAPWHVTIVRLSPVDRVDSDNEQGMPKYVRDQVALWLGCGDSKRDPVIWETYWEQCAKVGVRIVVRNAESLEPLKGKVGHARK